MSKVIKVKLTPESINAAKRELYAYKKWLEDGTRKLLEMMADRGLEASSARFKSAVYDGKNDVSVEVEDRGKNKMAVIALGNATLFIEFGTGITYPDTHPQSAELGMIRGEYGRKQGKNPGGWYYRGENGRVHSYGNPANMCMFYTLDDIEHDFKDMVRRAFRERP